MKYKLVASDFDRTLYDGEIPSISDENKKAIREYINLGGRFVISTGRMYNSIRPYAIELGLKGEIIAYQGATIYDIETSKLLFDIPIETEEAVNILSFIESHGHHCQIYCNDICYTKEINKYTKHYANFCCIAYNVTYIPLSVYVKNHFMKISKIMVIMNQEVLDNFYEKTIESYGGKYGFARSMERFIEITSIRANKGVAVKALADKYNIKQNEIVTIGDSCNDLAMIKYAGMGIAVSNAVDELKNVADYIGGYAGDSAVAKILYLIMEDKL